PSHSAHAPLPLHDALPIWLRSAHPRWRPELDPAYYAERADLDATVSGLRALLDISRTGPLARYIDKPFLPGRTDLDDDALAEHRSEEHTSELQSRFDLVCR